MKKTLLFCVGLILAAGGVVASANETMKAIVVHEVGGPEVMKYEDAPRPEPKDDEVLIRVMAAGVNPVDAYIRAGRFHRGGGNLPFTPGMDVAGVVEKTGAKIDKFKAGDPVYAYLSFAEQGGYAQFAIAKQDEVALKPKSISFEEAAGVPLAGTTAWQALDAAKIDKGQTILIHGGSGGVGHLAIQIAKARGAKVIATASTPNQSMMAELGADQTIDYTTTKFEDVVKDVDVVFNAARGDSLGRSYGVVKKGGVIVSITDDPDKAECEKRGIRGESIGAHPDAKVLEDLGRLIDEKKVRPVVSQTLPLQEAAVAHSQIETRHTRGKIVLKVAEAPK